jgi:Ni/Fe-hydrogenase subunit HybB-like protein
MPSGKLRHLAIFLPCFMCEAVDDRSFTAFFFFTVCSRFWLSPTLRSHSFWNSNLLSIFNFWMISTFIKLLRWISESNLVVQKSSKKSLKNVQTIFRMRTDRQRFFSWGQFEHLEYKYLARWIIINNMNMDTICNIFHAQLMKQDWWSNRLIYDQCHLLL